MVKPGFLPIFLELMFPWRFSSSHLCFDQMSSPCSPILAHLLQFSRAVIFQPIELIPSIQLLGVIFFGVLFRQQRLVWDTPMRTQRKTNLSFRTYFRNCARCAVPQESKGYFLLSSKLFILRIFLIYFAHLEMSYPITCVLLCQTMNKYML